MSRRDSLSLWVLPILFALVLVAMRQAGTPFWQAWNLDPSYYYLLNGLRVVEGLAPTDVSHPGTPIQVLIAAVIRVMHPGLSTDGVVDAVLADPESHLFAASSVIYVLVAGALWAMGRSIFSATGLLGPALLAQSAPFLSRIIPKFGLHPKPEAFIVIAVALLAAIAFQMVRSGRATDRQAALAGVVMGLGIACKVHFAVLGVVPLLLMDRRRFLIYAGISVAAFFVFVAPAIPSWEIWIGWMKRMVLGTGAYGEGAQTIIDPSRYPRAIFKLLVSGKVFFTVTLVASLVMLVAYFRLRRRDLLPADPKARLLAGLVAAQFLVVLSVAKLPTAHYMIPALMLTGPAIAILWVMARPLLPARVHFRIFAGLALVIVVAQSIQMVTQIRELSKWTGIAQGFDMKRFDGCAKVYFDAASAPSFAFQRGDMNALGRYSPKLAALFPADEYSWFVWNHTWWPEGLMQWNQPRDIAQVFADYPCVALRGNQTDRITQKMWDTHGFPIHDRCQVGEEVVLTSGARCDGTRVPQGSPRLAKP